MKTFAADVTADLFKPHIGEPFTITLPAQTLTLTLRSATVMPHGRPDAKRPPFSLVFEGPRQPMLPQNTYLLQHAQLGENAVFIVPIGQNETALRYEAAFG